MGRSKEPHPDSVVAGIEAYIACPAQMFAEESRQPLWADRRGVLVRTRVCGDRVSAQPKLQRFATAAEYLCFRGTPSGRLEDQLEHQPGITDQDRGADRLADYPFRAHQSPGDAHVSPSISATSSLLRTHCAAWALASAWAGDVAPAMIEATPALAASQAKARSTSW